ncbi:hypothetical protein [Arthrobacter alpinus]|nr:hypothetical protein [Arthrobacter alpinus]
MVSEESAMLGTLISLLEQSFPVDDVYNRLGQDAIHTPAGIDDAELHVLASSLWASLKNSLSPHVFVDSMLNSEPFNKNIRAREILEITVDGS